MKSRIIIGILTVIVIALGMKLYLLQNDYDTLIVSLVDDSTDQSALYVGDYFIGNHKIIQYQASPFIALDTVKSVFDDTVTLSNSGQRIYVNYEAMAFSLGDEDVEAFLNASMPAINVPLIYVDDMAYVSLDTICRLYAYEFIYFEETDSYLMLNENSDIQKVEIPKGIQTYKPLNGIFVKFEKTALGQSGYILGINEETGYKMILNSTGNLIFANDKLSGEAVQFKAPVSYIPTAVDDNEAIGMSWEAIENYSGNFNLLEDSFESSINVISPTWFNLNINGIVINSAEMTYVRKAHESGVRVWGLFKNNFDPDWTHELLTNETDMNYAIGELLFYSAFYELDGINFDFENVYLDDQDGLSAFIKKASTYLQKAGLTVSIDITRPGGSDQWSKVYDRATLADAVDYVCLMAYDEHWGSSPISGSVASLPWTDESIMMSIESIPTYKLILGMPLYMRVWEETENNDGTYVKTGSRAITLNGFESIKAEKSLEIQWDSESEQNYAEYFENGKKYRIWIEDETSILARLNLANHYGLPGIATWRRGYNSEISDDLIASWLTGMR